MSFLSTLPAAILETILVRLAPLFLIGTAGDLAAARHAAAQMLNAYHPETEDELALAANIISFSFQALEALGQAANQDQSLTRILRLRSGAVSLSRESEKARRRLIQLQKDRQQAAPAKIQPEPAPPKAGTPAPKPPTPARAEEDRRIAASLKRAEARIAALAHAEASGTIPPPTGPNADSSALEQHHPDWNSLGDVARSNKELERADWLQSA